MKCPKQWFDEKYLQAFTQWGRTWNGCVILRDNYHRKTFFNQKSTHSYPQSWFLQGTLRFDEKFNEHQELSSWVNMLTDSMPLAAILFQLLFLARSLDLFFSFSPPPSLFLSLTLSLSLSFSLSLSLSRALSSSSVRSLFFFLSLSVCFSHHHLSFYALLSPQLSTVQCVFQLNLSAKSDFLVSKCSLEMCRIPK